MIIQNGLLALFTANGRKLQAGDIEVATFRLFEGVYVGILPLLQFAVAIAVIAALQFVFYLTALGRAFRVTADSPPIAQLMGLDNRHVFALAMALSLAVVAIAGVFLAIRADFDPSIWVGGADLRLRSGDHRRPRQPVGNVCRRHRARRRASDRCAHQSGRYTLAGHIAFLVILAVRPEGLFPRIRT